MTDWINAHPYLTFFLILIALEEVGRGLRSLGRRKQRRDRERWCRDRDGTP